MNTVFTTRSPYVGSAAVFNSYQFGMQGDCFGGRMEPQILSGSPEVMKVSTAEVNHVNLIRFAT